MTTPAAPDAVPPPLVVVPVVRQVVVPSVIVAVLVAAGAVTAVLWTPALSPWWRTVAGALILVAPAALTHMALRPARRVWRSASPAPQWALEEATGTSIMRFRWTILVAIVVLASGVFTHTMPVVGLFALGVLVAMALHLAAAHRWQREHGRRLFVEAAVAASPQGARAYWRPGD